MRRDVYSGHLKLLGQEHEETLRAANNYAVSLEYLSRFEDTKSLLRKIIPVAGRVLGVNDRLTLKMRMNYARALCRDGNVHLDDIREGVETLEDTERIARRVFGVAHPLTKAIERSLQNARAALRARETPSPSGSA